MEPPQTRTALHGTGYGFTAYSLQRSKTLSLNMVIYNETEIYTAQHMVTTNKVYTRTCRCLLAPLPPPAEIRSRPYRRLSPPPRIHLGQEQQLPSAHSHAQQVLPGARTAIGAEPREPRAGGPLVRTQVDRAGERRRP